MSLSALRAAAAARRRRVAPALAALLLAACSMGPEMPPVDPGFEAPLHSEGPLAYRTAPANQGGSASPADAARPLLVLIHGTPGSADNFRWYLADAALAQHYDMLAMDRPGFGRSDVPVMPDLELQAHQLISLLPPDQPLQLLGHSLGAPLALWLAFLLPERVQGLTLVAGSLDPAFEQPRWYNRLADNALGRWLLPREWEHANAEVLALAEQLEALLPAMGKIRAPVLLIQGEQDSLVDPRSPQALLQRLPADTRREVLRLPEAGHFLLWEQPEQVRDALLRFHAGATR